MPNQKPRAIFIGVPTVAKALSELRQEWDFIPSVPDIATFWEGLNSGAIDANIQVILTLDQFFDPTGTDTSLEQLIVTMGPYCFFGVVSYTPSMDEQLRERVLYESYSQGVSESSLYYPIDPKNPNRSFDVALQRFEREAPETAEEAAAILSGRPAGTAGKYSKEDYQVGPAASSLGEVSESSEYLGQIVAVTSSKGGSGKSTIATTLSAYLAYASEASWRQKLEDRPLKVILLDLDVRDGQLGFLTGNSKPTVLHLALNGINEESLNETIIHSNRLKVDLLLAPKKPRSAEDTPPDFYIELLQQLRMRYDYIILDTSVNYLDPLLEKVSYPVADQIIFVSDIVLTSTFSMTRWIKELTKPRAQGGMGINTNKIGIVVNKALADVNMDSSKIERAALGLPILTAVSSNPKLVSHSVNMQSMELLLKHPQIRYAIRKLARVIVGSKYELSDDF